MNQRMKQEEINQQEWENLENWSTIFFSKRDSRASVPKSNPKHGWAINFAHPEGAKWICYLMLMFFAIGFIVGFGVAFGLLQIQ